MPDTAHIIEKPDHSNQSRRLVDPFGRTVTYLRVSVTDRCDFRCTYCMAEDMTFLPKPHLLSLEELDRVCSTFVARGIRKLRITGGEPLVRKNILWLFNRLGRHLDEGTLDELTLTTNGSQLARYAGDLYRAGVRRVNVSLDTLDEGKFARITRRGSLSPVLRGLDAAAEAGLKVKINTVALKGVNDQEYPGLLQYCVDRGFDLSFIETMPLGEIDEDRTDRYLPLSAVKDQLSKQWDLDQTDYRTGGPARYLHVPGTQTHLGFITPLSNNFCASCNRVRLTCTGTLYMCLGQNDHADLRKIVRDHPNDDRALIDAIDQAIARKPKAHDFIIDQDHKAPALARHMSVTGG